MSSRQGSAPLIATALDDPAQTAIVRAVADAHGIELTEVNAQLRASCSNMKSRGVSPDLWIVDLTRLARERAGPSWLITRIRGLNPNADFALACSNRVAVSELLQRWTVESGALALLPSLDTERFSTSVEPALRPLTQALDTEWDGATCAQSLARVEIDALRTRELQSLHRARQRIEDEFGDIRAAEAWVSGKDGFALADRSWRGRSYANCFVGVEAVDRLAARCNCDRIEAVAIGEVLRQVRVLEHVTKSHPFRDGEFFYRFTPLTERLLQLSPRALAADLAGRAGFERRDRVYMKTMYRECFVGAAAVGWLAQRYALTRVEAVYFGQAMMDLGLIRHVAGAHEFNDGRLYYEFTALAA